MNRFVRAFLALLLAPLIAVAAGVGHGNQFDCGGTTVTVEVTMSPVMGDANVTYKDGAGRTSGPHVATPDPTGGVDAAPAGTLRMPGDATNTGLTVRIKNGKLQYKNAQGKWVRGKKKRGTRTSVDGVGTLPWSLQG